MPRSSGRIPELDGLRGLAIALILWHHLASPALPALRESWLGGLRIAFGLSWLGVNLFFVLSGFLIGGILLDHRDSPRLARAFYLRRGLRILPLFFVTLLVAMAAVALHAPGSWQSFPAWVYGLFLTNFALAWAQQWDWLPFSVLWSLTVEEQFYLVAPWVVRAVSPARLPWLAAGAVLLAWILRAGHLLFWPAGHFGATVLTPFCMDGLALGVLLAWARRAPDAKPFWSRLSAHWPATLACVAAVLTALTLLHPLTPRQLALFGTGLINLCCALAVALALGVKVPLLAVRPLTHLGRHSYFVYLWHPLIGVGLIRWLGGERYAIHTLAGFGLVFLASAATWAAAALSWKWFEGPLVAAGQRHAY
ncbi:MAG: acyltransferase [Verrucomicrobia bacterium]|nr:acyltransferase [Verrucomicrobiota bacterium]